MSDNRDVVFELLDMCWDFLANIKQQIVYYRSCAYKEETAQIINKEVCKIKNILELFDNEEMLEPIHDYYATDKIQLTPGECSLSARVACLIKGISSQLERFSYASMKHCSFQNLVRQQSQLLLKMSKVGSRRWALFNSMLKTKYPDLRRNVRVSRLRQTFEN